MLSCLVEFNQAWAKSAPVLIIAVAARYFEHDGKPNRHASHDVGLALGNLVLQATSMGLFVHMMAGFDVEKTRQTYGVPDDYEPITAAAIGYGGDLSSLDQELRQRETAPRTRKPIEEFVFSGQFGRRAGIFGAA